MSRQQADLRLQLMLLPFTEIDLLSKDWFIDLAEQPNRELYRNHLDRYFMRRVFPLLHSKQQVLNIDELRLLTMKYFPFEKLHINWKTTGDLSYFYLEHLKRISKLFLTHRNGKIALKYWASKTDKTEEEELLGPYQGLHKVELWGSMNRMFTTDLLAILYLLEKGMDDEVYLTSYHSIIALEDVQLDQILSQGVAETHMHLNASGHFSLEWQRMMSPLRLSRTPPILKDQYIHGIHGYYEYWEDYIQQAVILRIVMADYLRLCHHYSCFEHYYKDRLSFKTESTEMDDLLHWCITGDIRAGITDPEKRNYNELYEWLKTKFDLSLKFSEQYVNEKDIWSNLSREDIIHRLLIPYNNYSTVENLFLFRALRHMNNLINQQKNDPRFASLFWKYIRIKNRVFQLMIQGNQIKGLDYFQEYYSRLLSFSNDLRGDISRTRKVEKYKLLLHNQLQNPYLHKLEVRIAPPKPEWDENKMQRSIAKDIHAIFTAYLKLIEAELCPDEVTPSTGRRIGALGIIYHFIKNEDIQGIEKCWLDGMRQGNETPAKLYFEHQRRIYQCQMKAIRKIREEIKYLSNYIVGIDAAGAELSLEPWVLAPIYSDARDSETQKLIRREAPFHRIRNLGLTYHVGEDFRHLMSGLRHIDEVIEHCKFHAGDRIGHGIAIGIPVQDWCNGHRVIIIPQMEHLDNLLWVWGIHKEGTGNIQIDCSYLEKRILQLAENIYKNIIGITVYDLWKAYRSKFKIMEEHHQFEVNYEQEGKNSIFCPYVKTNNQWNEKKLAHALHCKCYLYNMVEPIYVEVNAEEVLLLEQLQTMIQAKVSREGIIVETNPTSNRAIGEIENLFKHYIQNLNQRGISVEQRVDNGVMVTINSDDPIIFNTNINNEFAYIFYALIDKGYAREDILNWIDKVRETGLRTSFIESRQMDINRLYDEINSIVVDLGSLLE